MPLGRYQAAPLSLSSTTKMAAAEIDNEVTTKLLTLLNASATRVRKRKRDFEDSLALPPVKKMGGKRLVVPNVEEKPKESEREPIEAGKEGATATVTVNVDDEKEAESAASFALRPVDSVPRCIHWRYLGRSNGLTLGQFLLSRGTSSHSAYMSMNYPFSILGVCPILNLR